MRSSRLLPFVLVCFVAYGSVALPIASASGGCRDDIVESDGFRIRSVEFRARYAAIPAPSPGAPYSPVLRTELLEKFHDALRQESIQDEVEGATEFQLTNAIPAEKGGKAAVTFVDSCVQVIPTEDCVKALGSASPNCVDIVMRAYSLRIDTSNPWSSLLDTTRANEETFYRRVPAPVLVLNPKVGANYDRRYGFAGGFEVSSNLLDLPNNLRRNPLTVRATRLDLAAKANKSLENDFYRSDAALALRHQTRGTINRVSLNAAVNAQHVPMGTGDYVRTATRIGGDLEFRLGGPVSLVSVGANYLNSSNRFRAAPGAQALGGGENGFVARFVANGEFAGGYSRIGIWTDGGSADATSGTYRRLGTIVGYARDFTIADHQSISLEMLVGGGQSWGAVPLYARFFGGSSLNNFLYESTDSAAMAAMPTGPLLRSVGSGQATPIIGSSPLGGTSYWHANLNLAFPIPKWSQPLIPDITIDGLFKKDANCKLMRDADGNPIPEDRKLGQVLKSQGACSKNTLGKLFEKQGLTPDEAKAKAESELKSINSILGFLADKANLISVKPLFLFDAARLYANGGNGTGVRYGVGGGFQFTVVVAKFEAGYVYGLERFPGDPPGSFVARLVFQNLF